MLPPELQNRDSGVADAPCTHVHRLFETLLESVDDGVLIFDRDMKIVYMNAASERLVGRNRAEVLKNREGCGNILGCQDEFGQSMDTEAVCPVRRLYQSNPPVTIGREIVIKSRRSGEVWLENRYFPVRNEQGYVEHVICVLRDISERKAMEQQLFESRKLATFGVLTAGIAHELKNPLGILRSAAEIIANPERAEAEKREAAEFIKTETMRMDRTIRQFMAYARPNPPELAQSDLNEVVDHSTEIFLARDDHPAAVRVEKQLTPEPVRCWIDGSQIHQVLLNLLLNAEDALEGAGTISVRTGGDADWVLLEVADSGPGVDPGEVERIFDPFYTTKSDGSGLGLAVVRRIVTEHCGRIKVDRSSLGGTSFTIRLPRHPAERPIPVEIDDSVAPIGTGTSQALRQRKNRRG